MRLDSRVADGSQWQTCAVLTPFDSINTNAHNLHTYVRSFTWNELKLNCINFKCVLKPTESRLMYRTRHQLLWTQLKTLLFDDWLSTTYCDRWIAGALQILLLLSYLLKSHWSYLWWSKVQDWWTTVNGAQNCCKWKHEGNDRENKVRFKSLVLEPMWRRTADCCGIYVLTYLIVHSPAYSGKSAFPRSSKRCEIERRTAANWSHNSRQIYYFSPIWYQTSTSYLAFCGTLYLPHSLVHNAAK